MPPYMSAPVKTHTPTRPHQAPTHANGAFQAVISEAAASFTTKLPCSLLLLPLSVTITTSSGRPELPYSVANALERDNKQARELSLKHAQLRNRKDRTPDRGGIQRVLMDA